MSAKERDQPRPEDWKEKYLHNKHRDAVLVQLTRIADALERAYPPPPPPPEPVEPTQLPA